MGRINPVEVILPALGLSETTDHVIVHSLSSDVHRVYLAKHECWNRAQVERQILEHKYFWNRDQTGKPIQPSSPEEEMNLFPDVLFDAFINNRDASISAFGGVMFYLQRCYRDDEVFTAKV